MRHIIFSVVMAISFFQTAFATRDPDVRLVEDAVETDSKSFSLPGSMAGQLYFSSCDSCNHKPLKLADTSHFFVGKAAVDYASFKAAFAYSKRQLVTVFFLPETSVVTRIQLFAEK